ncbi:DJ-1/PfpI family domain protein [Burkholderia mallei]|nr:DJ-1/PfpI family domain protein [Burkholderia pseudomallei MSHR449]KGW88620.1 DJ-1/PfpI family domain protein [Burkholderia pseudomallei MSHR332]KOS75035.1 DJ-1/PfpI family domain protein [Burkholderia mallei]KOS84956.1 DJ-1/PfpI family domain protein [Burkholderia mallei]KOS97700.1 DJ-1/PfpI family domain protein [Burkholderia mallei]
MPPGTQITSSGGQSSNVAFGASTSPLLDATGSRVFHTSRTVTPGSDANTSCGPVRSSCCTCGNNSNPTSMVMPNLLQFINVTSTS